MFSLRKPSEKTIREFLDLQRNLGFSYQEVGASAGKWPNGYNVDRRRARLGEGGDLFRVACGLLDRWEMFNVDWAELCWPETAIAEGEVVGLLVQRLGIWSLNACRIVETFEQSGSTESYGFAYGTLRDHIERGEERFEITWQHADNSVWYHLSAFSRPNHVVSRVGYWYVRRLQRRFALDSLAAMVRATADS